MAAKPEPETYKPEDGATEASDDNIEPSGLRMDSGWTAWLQVLGSWILFMKTWYVPSNQIQFASEFEADGLWAQLGASLMPTASSKTTISTRYSHHIRPRRSLG